MAADGPKCHHLHGVGSEFASGTVGNAVVEPHGSRSARQCFCPTRPDETTGTEGVSGARAVEAAEHARPVTGVNDMSRAHLPGQGAVWGVTEELRKPVRGIRSSDKPNDQYDRADGATDREHL